MDFSLNLAEHHTPNAKSDIVCLIVIFLGSLDHIIQKKFQIKLKNIGTSYKILAIYILSFKC